MSKRHKSQARPGNNNWAMLIGGLLLAGILILFSLWSALGQITQDANLSNDKVLGIPFATKVPTRTLNGVDELPRGTVAHVDVVYFYRTPRCTACLNAQRFTLETIETYFGGHLQRGVLAFQILDMNNPRNATSVWKYKPTGSSLYIGVVVEGVEYLCPVEDIWFLTNNKTKFIANLKQKLVALTGE